MTKAPRPLKIVTAFVDSTGVVVSRKSIEVQETPPALPKRRQRWTKRRCIRAFADQILDSTGIDKKTMDAADRLRCWREAIAQFTAGPNPNPSLGAALLRFWSGPGISYIPAGLGHDLPLFVDALRHNLLPYGGPGLRLYRGDQLERCHGGIYGIAWTTSVTMAHSFAVRKNGIEGEGTGVVICADVPAQAIVVDPTVRSIEIGEHEYIVDPRLIKPWLYTTRPDDIDVGELRFPWNTRKP